MLAAKLRQNHTNNFCHSVTMASMVGHELSCKHAAEGGRKLDSNYSRRMRCQMVTLSVSSMMPMHLILSAVYISTASLQQGNRNQTSLPASIQTSRDPQTQTEI